MEVGYKNNLLTLIELRDMRGKKHRKRYGLFQCECGNTKEISIDNVRSGHIRSCGCLQHEAHVKRFYEHGLTDTRIHRIWDGMKSRCYTEGNIEYKRYGGRGIKVCDEWKNSFITFYEWAMKNGYSDNLSIDRIDYNGNYEPSNCRWSTAKEQANNTRRNIYITLNGRTQTLKMWCEEYKVPYGRIRRRLRDLGWEANEELFTTPPQEFK